MKCGRLLPLLLSLLLSVSLLAPAALARETEFFPDFPEPVPASAQDWSPADPSSFDAARQALLTAVRGEDASERSVLSLLSRSGRRRPHFIEMPPIQTILGPEACLHPIISGVERQAPGQGAELKNTPRKGKTASKRPAPV